MYIVDVSLSAVLLLLLESHWLQSASRGGGDKRSAGKDGYHGALQRQSQMCGHLWKVSCMISFT